MRKTYRLSALGRLLFSGFLMALAPWAYAGPMGFKESTMSMGDFSKNWREGFVNYALTAKDAVGIEAIEMRSDDQTLTRQALTVNYTRLAHRWNLPEAQANLWLMAGLGGVRGNDFSGSRSFASPGLQLDYETTRVYVAANARLYRAKDIRHDYGSLRAGFSFYETEYDETQPWFILETRRMHGLSDRLEVTPMLRLINKRYFVEAGISQDKQARFNFMYIF